MSQKDLELHSMDEMVHSLNNSTSIGRVLYTKQEREVKLPNIYRKNPRRLNNKLSKVHSNFSVSGGGVVSQTAATTNVRDLSESRHQHDPRPDIMSLNI